MWNFGSKENLLRKRLNLVVNLWKLNRNLIKLVWGFFYSLTIYRGWKHEGKKSKESLGKDPEKDQQNIAVGKKSEGNPSVGRPAGRLPMVRFLTIGNSGQPLGRPLFPTREQSSLSVDREQSSYSRSTAWSTEVHIMHFGACRSTTRLTDKAILLCLWSIRQSTNLGPKAWYGDIFETNLFSTK